MRSMMLHHSRRGLGANLRLSRLRPERGEPNEAGIWPTPGPPGPGGRPRKNFPADVALMASRWGGAVAVHLAARDAPGPWCCKALLAPARRGRSTTTRGSPSAGGLRYTTGCRGNIGNYHGPSCLQGPRRRRHDCADPVRSPPVRGRRGAQAVILLSPVMITTIRCRRSFTTPGGAVDAELPAPSNREATNYLPLLPLWSPISYSDGFAAFCGEDHGAGSIGCGGKTKNSCGGGDLPERPAIDLFVGPGSPRRWKSSSTCPVGWPTPWPPEGSTWR